MVTKREEGQVNGIAVYHMFDYTERGMAGGQDLLAYERRARDWSVVLWQDSLSAFRECVATCVRSQSGDMNGEEDVCRTATLLMAAMCEERDDPYEFAYGHGEETYACDSMGKMEKKRGYVRRKVSNEHHK